MLWVVTFSVFLPSLTSSSVDWATAAPGGKPSSVASSSMFFTRSPLDSSSLIVRLLCRQYRHSALQLVIIVPRTDSSASFRLPASRQVSDSVSARQCCDEDLDGARAPGSD